MIRQAVFLVGGLGSRLGDRTATTPKPLLPVAGRPFLDHLLDQAADHGFTDIVLLAGHHGQQVLELYDGRTVGEAKVRVRLEPERLGTGGALKWSADLLDERFLLANGDSWISVDLRAFADRATTGEATIALIDDVAGDRYGRVVVDETGLVTAFLSPAEAREGPINGGVYVVSRRVVEAMPEGVVSLEGEVLPRLVAESRVRGLRHKAYFIDIGVPADYERAERDFAART